MQKLTKKCRNLYLLNIFLILLYWFANQILGIEMDEDMIIKSFFFGGTIVGAGWYLQVILICYIAFVLIMKANVQGRLLCFATFIMLFIGLMKVLGLGINWYISLLALPLGMYLFKQQSEITQWMSRYKYLFVIPLFILFLVSTLTIFFLPQAGILSKVVRLICFFTQGIWFSLIVVSISNQVNIIGRVTTFLGKYSLEIFLLQGISFVLLRNEYWQVESPLFYIPLAFSITIGLAVTIKPLFDKIMSRTLS